MGKLRQTALILGEGPTEFFYFKSLCDVFKRLTIKPDYPKHTNIKELDAKIAEGVAMGSAISSASSTWIRRTRSRSVPNIRSSKQSTPSLSTNRRKVSTARWSSSRLTAAPNCSFSIISATPHAHTKHKNLCSKTSTNASCIGKR